jgi:CheY-like chemotaxis protein
MSHELRTPLNAILGFSEALEEGSFGELNPKQYNSILTIIKSGKHLLELINDILDISKIESGKLVLNLKQVNLQVLCHSSLDFVRPQAVSKKIQLNDEITNKITTIEADERHLRQMLVNLLGNAVKFTPEKGLVTLIVEENFTDSTISFKVIDTGIGIAPEHYDQLFQPFVQIDSGLSKNYPGTGLGLALVKRITEMHKGQVGVQSKLGEGSQFTVKLPLINFEKNNKENQAISAQHFEDQNIVLESKEFNKNSLNSSTEKQPELTSPLILIADDNEANVDTILDYFELKGYQLIVAKNGLETIQLAKEQQPQLILMDIQMPKIDGLEAIRTIRADPEIAKIKILALTAFARAEDREKCLEAGANDYLAKPFGLKNLSDKIEQLLLLD